MKKTKDGKYYIVSEQEMEELLRAKEQQNTGIDLLSSPAKRALISDLITRKIQNSSDLKDRLKELNAPKFKYTTVITIEFTEKKTNLALVADKITSFFPGSVYSSYKGDFIAFIQASGSAEVPEFDRNAMDDFLKSQNAYLAIANPVRSLLSLPTMYQDCKRAIRIGKIYEPGKNYFFAKNFFFEKTVELCLNPANDYYHNQGLGYICDPGMITLTRYDQKHGTNLTDTLYNYLMSGQSIAQCSRNMFVHRNTLINKLTKIEDILNQKLDDPYFMYKMFFSFQVVNYAEKVLGKQVDDFQR